MIDPLANLDSADQVIRAMYALRGLQIAFDRDGDAAAFKAGCNAIESDGFDVQALLDALVSSPDTMRAEALRRFTVNGYLVAAGAPWLRARTVVASDVMKDRGPKDEKRRALAYGKWAAIVHLPETDNPHATESELASEWSRGYRRTLAIIKRTD